MAKVTGPAVRRFALPSFLPRQTIPTVIPAVLNGRHDHREMAGTAACSTEREF
jgi:hypothetical protein